MVTKKCTNSCTSPKAEGDYSEFMSLSLSPQHQLCWKWQMRSPDQVWLYPTISIQYKPDRFKTIMAIINRVAACTAPGHNGPIGADRGEGPRGRLDVRHVDQLILDLGAISAVMRVAPANHGSICTDGSKRAFGRLDMLNIKELILHCAAIPTYSAGEHQGLPELVSTWKNTYQIKLGRRMLPIRNCHMTSWTWPTSTHLEFFWGAFLLPFSIFFHSHSELSILSRPELGFPQETTEPSAFSAAKEPPKRVAWIPRTSVSCDRTALLSPPVSPTPQLTTRPSERTAAKEAPKVSLEAWICVTSFNLRRCRKSVVT